MRQTILSLGANIPSVTGTVPRHTLLRAVMDLTNTDVRPRYVSSIYFTSPAGGGIQPAFANMVIVCETSAAPWRLLTTLKRMEWNAGRRPGRRWSRRALDIDIVDWGGQIVAWPPEPRFWRRLCLPHPRAHQRAFVLRPLVEIGAEAGRQWRHPVLGLTADRLLARLPAPERRPGPDMAVLVPRDEVWQTIGHAR